MVRPRACPPMSTALPPDEDFWDDLLAHIGAGQLLVVTGPELVRVPAVQPAQAAVVAAGAAAATAPDSGAITNASAITITNANANANASADPAPDLALENLIGQRLAERCGLAPPAADALWPLDAVVRAYVAARGRDQQERLYRIVHELLLALRPQPGAALRTLARITDLQLFISTTFDNLLAQAIDEERFGGQSVTRTSAFSPHQSTAAQQRAAQAPGAEPVVFKLFGEASSVPQYALHDEDLLEWLHALLSQQAQLPDWVAAALHGQPLLLLGCRLPDWSGRFLLRMATAQRLSAGGKQFFVVGSALSQDPALLAFVRSCCGPTRLQAVQADPTAFVTELHRRWALRQPAVGAGTPAVLPAAAASPPPGSIFISYVREDAAAAAQLAQSLRDVGGDVWLDQRRLQPGDEWEAEILSGIRRGVRLFVPLISRQTEAREGGYVFKEWDEAVERARSMPPNRRFIVPVVIDDVYDGNPARFRQVPERFMQTHFGWAPRGLPDAALLTALRDELRAMRRG